MKMKEAVMSVVLVLGIAVGASGEEYTFQQGNDHGYGIYAEGADTTIHDPLQGTQTPTGYLRVKGKYPVFQEQYNTLIRFEGLENYLAGEKIASATLSLFFRLDVYAEFRGAQIDIHPLLKSWSEADADWTQADSETLWLDDGAQAMGEFDPNDRGYLISSTYMGDRSFNPRVQYEDGQQFDFEIDPSLAQRWIDEPNTNFGVILVMDEDARTYVAFSSNEYTDDITKRPMLTLETLGPCPGIIPADIYADCYVDMLDLQVLLDNWLAEGVNPADINGDEEVNLRDFADLALDWLECNDPEDPSCDWTGP